MYCTKCGAPVDDGANFCTVCGKPLAMQSFSVSPSDHAGFWKRFAAHIIDMLILDCFVLIVFVTLGSMIGLSLDAIGAGEPIIVITLVLFAIVFGLIPHWLYYTIFESSSRKATPGKMVLGIVVTDLRGDRISLARANGRYWCKYVSKMLLYIGYIIAGFTENKQALHDIIAGTLVENR
jgi:uncharacterized RDD family membrane protein YckC